MNERKAQEILAEYADALTRGDARVEDLLQKYNIPPGSELEALLYLAQALEKALVSVQPNTEFVERLRVQLLGQEAAWHWLRQLSITQVAAGIAGIGGVTVAAGVLIWVGRVNWLRRAAQAATPIDPALAS
ncbi:MAG: hypothetical protein HC915_06860 [Anaerolineae bacterium]|nr:hypothetical protein [Anaerolineae bacterium]